MKVKLFFTLFLTFLFYIWAAVPFYSGDIKNHLVWGESLLKSGPMGFYEREFPGFAFPNYPPLSMWAFAASAGLYQITNQAVEMLNNYLGVFPSQLIYFFQHENTEIAFLKLPAIIASIGIGYCMFLFARLFNIGNKIMQEVLFPLLFLLNPAVLYITSVWGQIDLLPLMFFLFGVYFLFIKKIYLSFFLLGLAFLSKQTVLIFLAVYFLVVFRQFGLKTLMYGIGILVALFYLAYLPFHQLSLTWAPGLYRMNFSLVAESTSENALNLWGFLYDFQRHSDKEIFYGLSLQNWGYLMFGIVFLILTINFLRRKFDFQNLISFLFLTSLSYFFFLTRMHERYIISAIVFASLLVIFERKYLVSLISITVISFLNLYRGLEQPGISILRTVVESVIYLKILVIGYLSLLAYNLAVKFRDNK